MSSSPRILVVAQDYPWPATSGGRQRLAAIIDSICELGEVDLFSFAWGARDEPCEPPPNPAIARTKVEIYPGFFPLVDVRLRGRAKWVLSRQPHELSSSSFRESRRAFAAFVRPRYDVAWISRAATHAVLGDLINAPSIVDIDDLEDHKLWARFNATSYSHSPTGRAHRAAARAQVSVNAARWRQLQRSVAARAKAVVLCSELDARRSRLPNVVVMPNGYDVPARPLGGVTVSGTPTILMQGVLFYPPNAVGAQWLVDKVAPLLREAAPDVSIRLVGPPDGIVRALHDPPHVVVTERVPTMDPELARADVVAVPIHYGGGTRIKILEAFAHRIPVVATTLGAEGLDVEDGRDLLIADDPRSFADACARLIADQDLRRRTVDAAERLYLEKYQWSSIRNIIVSMVDKVGQLSAAEPESLGDVAPASEVAP